SYLSPSLSSLPVTPFQSPPSTELYALSLHDALPITRLYPFSINLLICSSYVCIPPMPQPIQTPTPFALLSSIVSLASSTAIFAAATAYRVHISISLLSFFSLWIFGSYSFSSAATCTGNSSLLTFVIKSIPEFPATMFSHIVFTSFPTGVTAPNPVTTTLLSFIKCFLLFIGLNMHVNNLSSYTPQRNATAPHVKPPPKPTNTIKSSSFILPLFTDSDKAIGMEAAELFP